MPIKLNNKLYEYNLYDDKIIKNSTVITLKKMLYFFIT